MLLDYIRILLDTGVVQDKSLENQDDSVATTCALTNSSYIYVAQRFPFTNLFIHTHVSNANASVMSAEYWDGTTWRAAVDFLDGTATAGATLAKSGIIQFTTHRSHGWAKVNDTSESNAPTALNAFTIYDSYWVRLKVSATVTGTTALKEITYAFTSSQELKKIDVEIDSFFSAFETGKTDWNKELVTASKILVTDLRRLGLIIAPGQIIELDDVYLPATYKALEVIYYNLGPSYKEKLEKVAKLYTDTLSIKRMTVDANGTGSLEPSEIGGTIRRLVR